MSCNCCWMSCSTALPGGAESAFAAAGGVLMGSGAGTLVAAGAELSAKLAGSVWSRWLASASSVVSSSKS